jgi:hypothetical protein
MLQQALTTRAREELEFDHLFFIRCIFFGGYSPSVILNIIRFQSQRVFFLAEIANPPTFSS